MICDKRFGPFMFYHRGMQWMEAKRQLHIASLPDVVLSESPEISAERDDAGIAIKKTP